MQVTAFPRTPEMTYKHWRRFRSFNWKRRNSKPLKPELDFPTWLKGNTEGWPGSHKQASEKPVYWPDKMWLNFLACRSYRKRSGLKAITISRYELKHPLEDPAEKLARVIAKINAKAGGQNVERT